MPRRKKDEINNVNENAQVQPEAEIAEVAESAEVADERDSAGTTMAEALKVEIEALVAKRNDCAQFNEYNKVMEIDKQIADKVGLYTDEKERLCFEEIRESEHPLLTAAKKLTYDTIKVTLKKYDGGRTELITDDTTKFIDVYKLNSKLNGVGEDNTFIDDVEALNCIFTMNRTFQLGLDPTGIPELFKMNNKAKTIVLKYIDESDPTRLDEVAFKEFLLKSTQDIVDKMIGQGTVSIEAINYILMVYSKKGREALSVSHSGNTQLMGIMLEICHSVITGKGFTSLFKAKKAR